jgi:urease accessory protein
LRGDPLAREFIERATAGGWPFSPAISAALEGLAIKAPLDAVLSGITYATIAAILSAAMKLLRIGQNACQSLLTEALAEAASVIGAAKIVRFDEIGWFNPWLDIAAARHESADARMFIS